MDEVSFLFSGGTPGWRAAYRSGQLTEDPSGRPVVVAGAAHLVVRLEPAAGVDLSQAAPVITYDGPTDMKPPAPSGVAEIRRTGDFEGVTSWVIGLGGTRPFEVVVRHGQLVVRVAASSPRSTRCSLPGAPVTVGYPARWYAELSERWTCRFFNQAPFVVVPASDATSWAVTVERSDVSASEVVRRTTDSALVRSHPTEVAGLPATVLDITETGHGMLPRDYRSRMYVVATAPRAVVIASTPEPPGPLAVRNQVATDRITGLLRQR